MIFNTSGGVSLNFKVAGGVTRPESPRENTIWINTDVEIPSWIFSATEPEEPAEGMVWISTSSENSYGFNAMRKNGIMVYPLEAWQYSDGEWAVKDSMIYKDSVWRSLWSGNLYNWGDECTLAGGTWMSQAVPRTSGGASEVRSISKGSASMSISAGSSNTGTIIRKSRKINLSGQKKLVFNGELYNPSSAGSEFWASVCVWSNIGSTYQQNVAAVAHQGSGKNTSTITVDVSGLRGEFYVGFALYGSATLNAYSLKVI